MGFFGFGKKKSDSTAIQKTDSVSMELPTIDGKVLSMDALDHDSDNMGMQMPPLSSDAGPEMDLPDMNNPAIGSQNVSSQNPNDSSGMPYMPDIGNPSSSPNSMPDLNMSEVSDSEIVEPSIPTTLGSIDLNSQLGQQNNNQSGLQYASSMNSPVDYDDVNKLFISEDWKEPDWSNYDPYSEDKIDEPVPQDFGMNAPSFDTNDSNSSGLNQNNGLNNFNIAGAVSAANMPSFNSNNSNDSNSTNNSDMSMPMMNDDSNDNSNSDLNSNSNSKFKEPAPVRRPIISSKPVELFIKGKAYARVFTELDQMNTTLSKIDSKLGNYEDIVKREEPLMNNARDQMEYLYKKLTTIDKKIFTN